MRRAPNGFRTIVCNAVVLAVLAGSLLGCPFLAERSVPIWGTVDLAGPVDAASVAVTVDDRRIWSGECADGAFLGRAWRRHQGAVRVEAVGVTLDGAPLDATLSMYAPSYRPGEHLEVNIFTTLVDRYRNASGCDYEEATLAVERGLRLPIGLNYAELLHHDAMRMYLDASILLARAESADGLDGYLDALVAGWMSEDGAPTLLGSLYESLGGESSFYEDLAIAAAQAAGSSLGEQAAGALLKHFGLASSEPGNQAILDALAAQNARLEKIEGQLTALQGQLVQLEQQLERATVDILFESSQQAVRDAVINLDDLMTRLGVNFTVAQAQSDHPLDAHAFGLSMIGNNASPQNDVPHMLATINGVIMPDATTGHPGALGRYALSVNSGGGHGNLLTSYKAFEAYFGKILAYQYRGLGLITEAINTLESGDSSVVQYNNIDTYMNGVFLPRIAAQVDEFMRWVDYLVLANADFVTDVANPRKFLPKDAGLVYKRADFVAQQFSSRHLGGTVMRMIGQPGIINAYWDDPEHCVVETVGDKPRYYYLMALHPIYRTVYNLQSSDFYVTTRPAWARPYIEWNYDAGSGDYRTGRSTSEVAVAKFVLVSHTEPGGGPFPPDDWKDCWALAGRDEFFDRGRPIAGYVEELRGVYTFGLADDGVTFEYREGDTSTPLADRILYGSYLFPVRHVPSTARFATSPDSKSVSPSDNNSVTASYDANLLKWQTHTNIGNVKVTSHSHYDPSGYAWTTYDYASSHSASRQANFVFGLEQPSAERWQIVTSGSLKSKYNGTSWNIHTSGAMSVGAGHAVASQKTPSGDYQTQTGTYNLPVAVTSQPHKAALSMSISGGVKETRESHASPPKYTVDSVHQFTELRFEVISF